MRVYDNKWEDDRGKVHKSESYHPVYRFRADGKEYKVWSSYGSGRRKMFKVGDTETIRYDPDDPKHISTKVSRKASRHFAVFFMLLGLLFIFLNVLVMVRS